MRIATYNVRNLLDEDQAARAAASPKTENELKALAGTIGQVSADVLLLQEVGGNEILASVNDRLNAPYPYLEVLPGNSVRGIHLAILSREPFELTSHQSALLADEEGGALHEYETEADAAAGTASPARIQRDLMLAEIALEDAGVLALFNVHLKSKTNRDWRLLASDVIRAAEVRHVVEIVTAYLDRHPRRPVILGGDFNDTPRSDVLAPLFELLTDPLGERLAKTGRNPSTYWPKRRMRIDFLLLSPAAVARLNRDSPKIHAGQRAQRASDHYAVSLDLDFTRAPA